MLDINAINQTIISGAFTNDQLDSISSAIKFARAQLASKNRYTLVKGSKVKFTNTRSGQVVTGNVEKVNRKFVIVRVGQFNTWRVPANMLSAA